jgi:mRNA interferase MazF
MTSAALPARGEVWFTEFDRVDQVRGHEQAGPRPALVLSIERFHRLSAQLAWVAPITSTVRTGGLYVPLQPPEGGVRVPSIVRCDHLYTVSLSRLTRRWGAVDEETLVAVQKRILSILDIPATSRG